MQPHSPRGARAHRTGSTRRAAAVLLVGVTLSLGACGSSAPPAGQAASTSSTTNSSTTNGAPATNGGAGTVPGTSAPPATSATSTPRVKPTEVPGSALTGEAALLGPVFTVPASGITMSFRQFGSGPELLLVPGQAAPMSLWPLSTLRDLASRYHVTIYDNRSLGATTDDLAKPLTMDQMADDLVALTGALGQDRPEVFGWSTGGEIALVAMVRHPGTFGRVVITGAMPGGASSVRGPEANITRFEDPATPPTELLPLLFAPGDVDGTKRFVEDYVKVEQTVVPADVTRRYAECEHAFLDGPGYDRGYAALDVDLTVVNGKDDQLVPAGNAEVIGRLVPHAVVQLEAGGHAWFIEHPDRLALLLPGARP